MQTTRRILGIFFSVHLAFPSLVAAEEAGQGVTTVVVPVRDGIADRASGELADALREALRRQEGIRPIESKVVDAIIQYDTASESSATLQPPGSSDPNRVEAQLADAKARYLRFDNRGALQSARGAVAAADAQVATTPEQGGQLVEALLTLTMAAQATKEMGTMQSAMERVARVAPTYTVDPVHYPPSLVAALAAAKARLAAQGVGELTVESAPAAVQVLLNGVPAGVTPLRVREVPVGSYQITLQANRYESIRQTAVVQAGKETAVQGRLRWAKGRAVPQPGVTAAEIRAADARAVLAAGVRIAELTRAEKVIAVDVDEDAEGSGTITARMIDGLLKAGQPPVIVRFDRGRNNLHAHLAKMTQLVAKQAMVDPRRNPTKATDPLGEGDPVLLGARRRSISPVVLGAVGAGVVGGILAALLAFRGGGAPATGAVQLSFR